LVPEEDWKVLGLCLCRICWHDVNPIDFLPENQHCALQNLFASGDVLPIVNGQDPSCIVTARRIW
jgi:hypothetical protein